MNMEHQDTRDSVLKGFRPTHDGYVQLFKCACVNKDWQKSVKDTRDSPEWNHPFVLEALQFSHNLAYLYLRADFVTILRGLAHYQGLRDSNVQRHGITALHLLMPGGNSGLIIQHGGVGNIVSAMVMNPHCAQLQELCCRVLLDLTGYHGSTRDLWRPREAEESIQASVRAMKKFPNILDMQKAGCLLLAALAEPSPGSRNVAVSRNQDKILQVHGLQTVFGAMHQHAPSLDLESCKIFSHFALQNCSNWQRAEGNEIIKTALNALRNCVTVSFDRKQALCLVRILHALAESPPCVEQIADAGGIELFVYSAASPLASLASCDRTTPLQEKILVCKIQQIVCQIIGRVMSTPGFTGAVVKASGVEMLVGRITNKSHQPWYDGVLITAVQELHAIALIDTDQEMIIHRAGGLQAILLFFDPHGLGEFFREACGILSVLACMPNYKRIMMEQGVVHILKNYFVDRETSQQGDTSFAKLVQLLDAQQSFRKK